MWMTEIFYVEIVNTCRTLDFHRLKVEDAIQTFFCHELNFCLGVKSYSWSHSFDCSLRFVSAFETDRDHPSWDSTNHSLIRTLLDHEFSCNPINVNVLFKWWWKEEIGTALALECNRIAVYLMKDVPCYFIAIWNFRWSWVDNSWPVVGSLYQHPGQIVVEINVWTVLLILLQKERECEELFPFYSCSLAFEIDLRCAFIRTFRLKGFINVLCVTHH